MKTKVVPFLLIINASAAFANSNSELSLSNVNCKQNLCSIEIVNSNNEKQGEFFLSKKINPETGVSIYTAETINSKNMLTDSNLIVCLKNHECRLFKSTEGFQVDYAYLNNEFFNVDALKIDSKRYANSKINNQFFSITADTINIFEGNGALNIPFTNNPSFQKS